MANVVKHRFASPKVDGADATQVQPSHWNDGHIFSGGAAGDLLTRDPTDALYGAKWTPAPVIPPWTDVPYNPTNFQGVGGAPWTVSAGNVITYAYTVNGRAMLVLFYFNGTDVGPGNTHLRVLLPAGFVSSRSVGTSFHYYLNGITGTGLVTCTSSFFDLMRDIIATPWAAGGGIFLGQIVIPLA
jgi:hypothetical protein